MLGARLEPGEGRQARGGGGDQDATSPSATARGRALADASTIQTRLGPSTRSSIQPVNRSERESGDQTAVVAAYWSKYWRVWMSCWLGAKTVTRWGSERPSPTYQIS